jgi:hypothetical protein
MPAPPPVERDLVLVGGLHRSGTSVFARTLATHPDIAGITGSPAPEDEGQHLQDVYEPALAHGGAGRFAFDPAAHYTEDSPLVSEASARRILAAWSHYADPAPRLLVEKSPPNLIWMRFLQALFPGARFVVVKRHPAVVSLRMRPFRPDTPIVELLEHWIEAHDIMAGDLPSIHHVRTVYYEMFAAEPEPTLRRLAPFLGVAPDFDVSEVSDDRSAGPFEQWLGELESIPPLDRERIAAGARRHGYDLGRLEPIKVS